MEWMAKVKVDLRRRFEMKDLGPVHHCLGIEFHQDLAKEIITMSQEKFTEAVLQRFGMKDCKPITTPLDANTKLKRPEILNEAEMENFPYQSIVGSLMYLATSTRPDIAYAKTGKEIKGFADADWGGCVNDRRSYTGYTFILANAAVSWEARKQRTVALSSTEAEYMALSEATKEAIYILDFLVEIGICLEKIKIYNDNQGDQKLVRNPIFHSRTKHFDMRHHFIREAHEKGSIAIEYMPTDMMPADVLTKGLFGPKHLSCIEFLGVRSIITK